MRKKVVPDLWRSLSEILGIFLLVSNSCPEANFCVSWKIDLFFLFPTPTVRETTRILCSFWCPAFICCIPLSPERWSIFSIITILNLILGSAPRAGEEREGGGKSPITIPLVISILYCSKRPATSKFPNHSFISRAVLWNLIVQT